MQAVTWFSVRHLMASYRFKRNWQKVPEFLTKSTAIFITLTANIALTTIPNRKYGLFQCISTRIRCNTATVDIFYFFEKRRNFHFFLLKISIFDRNAEAEDIIRIEKKITQCLLASDSTKPPLLQHATRNFIFLAPPYCPNNSAVS